MTTKAKTKPKTSNLPKKVVLKKTDIDIKQKKVDDLIDMLNRHQNADLQFMFWKSDKGLGDIMGTVPIVRTTKKVIEGSFNPYESIKEEKFLKFWIIDISDSKDKWMTSQKDHERKIFFANKNMEYIKHNNINIILSVVLNNL